MKWIIRPSTVNGSLAVPPSKSHTIRALLVGTLAQGVSRIQRPLLSGDGASALGVARAMGATVVVEQNTVQVSGVALPKQGELLHCDCGNSGTSMRLFSAVAALSGRPCRFDGDNSLRTRKMASLLQALEQLGARYTIESSAGDVPFTIQGPIQGGTARVSGITSQFLSALLLSAPLAPHDTTLVVENLQERPYAELTLWWLDKLGIEYRVSDDFTTFFIRGGQRYRAQQLLIPSDFSSATFGAVAGALCGGAVALTGLDFSDPQGDKAIFNYLQRMGAAVVHGEPGVRVSAAGLTGCTIDMNATPDAVPAFAVVGTAAAGVTRLTNVPQARIKETDRLAVMCAELTKMGARISEEPDGLVIERSALRGTLVNGHHDHRVVMALALAGMIAQGETVIETAEAAEVTYADFVKDFTALGAHIEVVND